MKIYVSHNFKAARIVENEIVPIIKGEGHSICSTWHSNPLPTDEEGAIACWREIGECNAIFHYAKQLGEVTGRGKYIELGIALALGKECIVILSSHQDLNCVFYRHPRVVLADSTELALKLLRGRNRGETRQSEG